MRNHGRNGRLLPPILTIAERPSKAQRGPRNLHRSRRRRAARPAPTSPPPRQRCSGRRRRRARTMGFSDADVKSPQDWGAFSDADVKTLQGTTGRSGAAIPQITLPAFPIQPPFSRPDAICTHRLGPALPSLVGELSRSGREFLAARSLQRRAASRSNQASSRGS